MGRLGGGLDTVMEPPIYQTLYVTLLKYLRAATFENQFSVIFNSTLKITKHKEYSIWASLVSNKKKVFNRDFSIKTQRENGDRGCLWEPPPHMPQLEEQLPPATARTGPSRAPSRKDPPHLWFQHQGCSPGSVCSSVLLVKGAERGGEAKRSC